MPVPTLVLSRFSTLPNLQECTTFSSLTIDGSIFVDHLVDAQLCHRLGEFCTALDTLTVNFGGCGARIKDGVLDAMFTFFACLHNLRRLEMRNFMLFDPDTPPNRPACLRLSPLSVRKLTIAHTQSSCLTYLLECISAQEVSLDSCTWVEKIPTCSRLELYGIVSFEDAMERLLEWDGDDLVIDSCPFLDEDFIYELLQRMTAKDERIWPSARLHFEGYPYAIRRKLDELLDVRSRL